MIDWVTRKSFTSHKPIRILQARITTLNSKKNCYRGSIFSSRNVAFFYILISIWSINNWLINIDLLLKIYWKKMFKILSHFPIKKRSLLREATCKNFNYCAGPILKESREKSKILSTFFPAPQNLLKKKLKLA